MEQKNGHRKNLSTKQPGIEYGPEGNGWPEPLVDESNPVAYKITAGKSGSVESRRVDAVKG